MNVLKSHLRISIVALLESGVGQREIERRLGVDRKTIRRYQRLANSPTPATGSERLAPNSPGVATGSDAPEGQTPAPRPPAPDDESTTSACEPHRAWIESQVLLGRNAMAIFQDLVERHAFTHQYNSVKRFVARLKRWFEDIFEYIAADNPDAAARTVEGIFERPQVLAQYPEIGHKYLHSSRNVRILQYGHFRIAYLVKADGNVDILGVFHGALDITKYQL